MAAELPTVLVLAGGTGGHVYPALAVALELQNRGHSIRWLGTERGLEARVVRVAGLVIDFVAVRGLRGKGLLSRIFGVFALLAAALQSLWLVFRIRPACVLGMGGYVAGPAGVAAWLLRRPLVIHEQNSVAGTTNRLLSRFATRVLAAYPAAFEQAKVLGNPVRADLLSAGEQAQYDYRGQRPLRLFVVGGSLGAKALNEALPPAVAALVQGGDIEVRHQTGVDHIEDVRSAYAALGQLPVEVLPYIEDMAAMYAWADLVLCRAGALTVAELSIMARPAVLVPLPNAIDNHQYHNADWLVSRGAALMLSQSEMTSDRLVSDLAGLRANPEQLQAMSAAARQAAFPEATGQVADVCQEVCRD